MAYYWRRGWRPIVAVAVLLAAACGPEPAGARTNLFPDKRLQFHHVFNKDKGAGKRGDSLQVLTGLIKYLGYKRAKLKCGYETPEPPRNPLKTSLISHVEAKEFLKEVDPGHGYHGDKVVAFAEALCDKKTRDDTALADDAARRRRAHKAAQEAERRQRVEWQKLDLDAAVAAAQSRRRVFAGVALLCAALAIAVVLYGRQVGALGGAPRDAAAEPASPRDATASGRLARRQRRQLELEGATANDDGV